MRPTQTNRGRERPLSRLRLLLSDPDRRRNKREDGSRDHTSFFSCPTQTRRRRKGKRGQLSRSVGHHQEQRVEETKETEKCPGSPEGRLARLSPNYLASHEIPGAKAREDFFSPPSPRFDNNSYLRKSKHRPHRSQARRNADQYFAGSRRNKQWPLRKRPGKVAGRKDDQSGSKGKGNTGSEADQADENSE